MFLKSSYVLLLFQIAKCSTYDEDTLIETNVGSFVGLKDTEGEFVMYLGIPYAKIQKKNVFGPSIPYPSMEEVYEAYDDSIMCPQINQHNHTVTGRLDCLRLNIFVPASIYSSNLMEPITSVMIWIYGGGFQYGHSGRSVYGPNYIVNHDVILVTFNYRVGPYGFMCLDNPQVPGNQGLRDQYLAFKWVKENIQAFGGDPYQITLFGGGAGAHSIDFHLISHKDLMYSKVILQSGNSQAGTALGNPDKSAALKMAKFLDFPSNSTREALKFLSKAPIEKVITAANTLKIQFRPCVESMFDDVEPFLATPWVNARVPKIKGIPVIMGFNKLEMARSIFTKKTDFYKNLTIVADHLEKLFDYSEQDLAETTELITHFYFGGEQMSEKLKWQIIHYISDFNYVHPVHRTLQKYLDNGASKIYFYMFSYVGGRNTIITANYGEYKTDKHSQHLCCASHADELGYLFSNPSHPDLSSVDQTIMERMTKMWTNFAKTSQPTNEKLSEELPAVWRPVTNKIYYYLNIDSEFKIKKRPLHDRMAFWDLFYKYNKHFQRGYEVY